MTLDVFQTATSEILGAKNEVRLLNAKNPEALGLKSKTEALSELKFQLQFDLAKDVYVPCWMPLLRIKEVSAKGGERKERYMLLNSVKRAIISVQIYCRYRHA